MKFFRENSKWILALFLIGFLVYAFNLNNGLFWDDDDWIINNPYVHSFSYVGDIFSKDILSGFGLNSNYYRPLLLLSFTANYVIGGIKPFGYHLLSNLFHIGNGILIFFLLLYVLKWRLPAFIASLLFLVHPLQTEAVTYISGRGDPMSVFFMLFSILVFIKYNNSNLKKYLFGSLVLMLCAILSRETAVLLAPLFLIVYVSFLTKEKFWRSIRDGLFKIWPYFALAGCYGFLRLTVLNFQNTLNFYNTSNIYADNLSYRLYTFGHVLLEYLKLIFVPIGLHMERNFPVHTSFFQFPVWIGYLVVVVIMAIGWYLYRLEFGNQNFSTKDKFASSGKIKEPDSKISNFRIWFFAWSWFFISLSMVSGIIPINAIIYEHWLYLPLIGFFVLAGFYFDKLIVFLRFRRLEVARWAMMAAMIVYLGFFGLQTIRRNIIWGDPVAFYEAILEYSPDSIRVTNNLGNIYSKEGRTDDAIKMYQKIIDNPGNFFAQPYYNLGNIYLDKGDLAKAEKLFVQAIEIDPSFPFAYQNLAIIYANTGHIAEAIKVLEGLKKMRPDIDLDNVIEDLRSQI